MAAQISDLCSAFNAVGVRLQNMIGGELIKRSAKIKNVWRDRVEQIPWLDNIGTTYNYLRTTPSLVPDSAWTQTATSGGDSDVINCDPAFQVIPPPGYERVPITLFEKAQRSQYLCATDLRSRVEIDAVIQNLYDQLALNTNYAFYNRYQDQYTAVAGHKIIMTPSFRNNRVESPTAFPNVVPTSPLTQGLLDVIRDELDNQMLMDNGLQNDGNGGNVYELLTDSITSTYIIEASERARQDVRFSSWADTLLNGTGNFLGKTYAGFKHVGIQFPARWDFVAGAWVRVYPFNTTTSVGRVTTAYLNAAFQDSYIWMPQAMKMAVPKPIKSVGPAKFTPLNNYMGDWRWFNNPGVLGCNVEGTSGFWFTVYRMATLSNLPELGYVIRHQRCDLPQDTVGCTQYYGYTVTP